MHDLPALLKYISHGVYVIIAPAAIINWQSAKSSPPVCCMPARRCYTLRPAIWTAAVCFIHMSDCSKACLSFNFVVILKSLYGVSR